MPVILATQEAEIRRIVVQGQPRQKKVHQIPLSTEKKMGVGSICQSSQLQSQPRQKKVHQIPLSTEKKLGVGSICQSSQLQSQRI
jgi:cobalamin biosynthesis protein CbiG